MTDALSLRPYRPADRERVLELHETALRDAGAFLGDGEREGGGRRDYEADLDDVTGTYRDPDRATFLVGEVDGRIGACGSPRRASIGGTAAGYDRVRRERITAFDESFALLCYRKGLG